MPLPKVRRRVKSSQLVTKKYLKSKLRKQNEVLYYVPSGASTEDVNVSSSWGGAPQLTPLQANINGNEVRLLHLKVSGRMTSADTAGNMIRVIIFRALEPGANTSSSDFPEQVGSTTLGCFAPWADKKKRNIRVLFDRVYVLHPDSRNTKFDINLKLNSTATYSSASNFPQMGDIQMAYISDSTAASHPQISFLSQMSYIDA